MRTKHEIISETLKWMEGTDDDIRPLLVAALCGAVSWLAWLCLPKGTGAAGVGYAFGLFAGSMFSVWLLIYARRAWLSARAIFELLAAQQNSAQIKPDMDDAARMQARSDILKTQ